MVTAMYLKSELYHLNYVLKWSSFKESYLHTLLYQKGQSDDFFCFFFFYIQASAS